MKLSVEARRGRFGGQRSGLTPVGIMVKLTPPTPIQVSGARRIAVRAPG